MLSLCIALQLFKHIHWRSLLVILSASLFGHIGAFFVLDHYGEQEILNLFLGVFLIAVVIYLFKSKPPKPDTNKTSLIKYILS
ncbi:TSUP family transporter [Alkalihalobacterium alkalinitrilicum]|uniref:TSUP family transporter n=1 Tax=Alkalihalobacterium alkalinitrilicum TaxID=427920 RepID=UPI00114E68DE